MLTIKKILGSLNTKQLIVFGIVTLFFIVYGLQAFLNHYFFRTNALDYGFHLQAMYRFMHFETGPLTVFANPLNSYFQIHPSFTLMFLSPINWILKPIFGSYTLLLIQNMFIIAGGYYTYKVILFKSDSFKLSIVALIHYFVLWGHFGAIAFEYIDATIASTLVPIFFYYFFKEKYWASLIVFTFIITARENMPIWFIFIGLFLGIEYLFQGKTLKWPVTITIISIAYLAFIFVFLMPIFKHEGYTYNRFQYSSLGNNIPEAILFLFKHPIESAKLLFINHLSNPDYDGIKIEFWYVFLLSGGLILFRKPHYFLLFIPIIAQKLFSNDYVMWGINIFYSIEIVSIISIAAFLIISSFKNKKLAFYIGVLLCVFTFSVTVIKMNNRVSKWYNKSKEKIYDSHFYKSEYNISEINRLLELIPKEASVCAGEKLVPHLAFREKIYYFPYINDAEYLVLLFNSSTYPLNKTEYGNKLNELMVSDEWEIANKTMDAVLLKRKQLPE